MGKAGYYKKENIVFLWILVFAFLIRNTVFVRMRDASSFSSLDIYNTSQIIIILILFLILLLKGVLQKEIFYIKNTSFMYFKSIYILGMISALWSTYPEYSGYRAFEALIIIIAVHYIFLQVRDFEKAENMLLTAGLIVTFINFYGLFQRHHFVMTISALHATTFSISGNLLFLYCVGELINEGRRLTETKKRYMIFCGAIGLLFLIVSTSSASLISCAFGILIIPVLGRNKKARILGLFYGSIAFAFILYLQYEQVIIDFFFIGKTDYNISRLSGRLYYYELFWFQIKQKPLLGWGFEVFSRLSQVYLTNSHNIFFGVLGGMGILGLTIAVLFLFKSAHEILLSRKEQRPGYMGCGIAIPAAILNGCAKTYFWEAFQPSSITLFCILSFFSIYVCIPHKHSAIASTVDKKS